MTKYLEVTTSYQRAVNKLFNASNDGTKAFVHKFTNYWNWWVWL